MMKKSAGLLFYRVIGNSLEVFLVHPGGPFWKNKDIGAWSIPKGEFTGKEKPLDAARREVEEEVGIHCNGPFLELTPLKQKSGKLIYAWAQKKDVNPGLVKSNIFEMEWPPKSNRFIKIPELDKGEWFDPVEAKQKINTGQVGFIDELFAMLKGS